MQSIKLPTNKNTLAWLVLLGFFVLFLGLFTLASLVLKKNSLLAHPDKTVTEQALSAILQTHPQSKFKHCIASVLTEKAQLVNQDIYNCEVKESRATAARSDSPKG